MMLLGIAERSGCQGVSFNMTPVIDIVFLLIVFFVVVFQFIGTESSQVDLPQGCNFAESDDDGQIWPATITMRRTDEGHISFVVGTEKIKAAGKTELVQMVQRSLNGHLQNFPEDERVVVLRIDRNISFADAQYALVAAAESSASGLRLATLAVTNQGKD
jgi:biopolymer transport protein ExbD